ncbi:MAG: hypothetical protein WEE67_04165 [Chloroflexota bacterium]
MPGFGDFDDWEQFRASFDPVPVLEQIGWTAEQVLQNAESLLTRGHGLDPAAAWHELTRLIHPSHWKKLKGDARTAMDFRIAGEMLLLFYEDIARKGDAPRRARWSVVASAARASETDRTELDATLSRFGLSPHAPVVVILEGKTEQTIVPLVMDLMYKPSWRNRIRLFDVQGADQNLDALAAYAAVPALTESERDVIVLAHPPTHFVVLSDAEGKNASQHAREQRRQRWVERIYDALPFDVRDEVDLGELDGLVHIFVWDESGSDFERAHFTDDELADGLLAIAPHGPERHDLLRRLAASRRDRTNLKKVWQEWGTPPRPQKPRLARHVWRVLSARIESAFDSGTQDEVPIVRLLRDVMGIARKYPRHYQIVMRRRPKPAEQSSGR